MNHPPLHSVRPIGDLRDMLAQSVRLYADKPAFLIKDARGGPYRPVTYRQFGEDVASFGTALLRSGFQGARVAIIGENRYEWAVAYMATVCGLGVAVPLDKELPPHEIASLIRRSRADVLVHTALRREDVAAIRSGIPTVRLFVDADLQEDARGTRAFSSLMKEGEMASPSDRNAYLSLPIDPSVLQVLLFTSGTTADSKAVMLSQRNLCSNLTAMCSMLYIDEKDTFLSVLPLHHTYECTCGFLCPVYRGCTVAYAEGLRQIPRNLQESQATLVLVVPLMLEAFYRRILSAAAQDPEKAKKLKTGLALSRTLRRIGIDVRRKLFAPIHDTFGGHLRLFIAGGAPIDPAVMKGMQDFGFHCVQGYGLTECAPILALNRDRVFRNESAGLPLPGVDLRIDEPDEDGVGEIVGRGPNVMLGYYENEEATAEALRDGWFHTGDLGYLDRDGFLIITGRKKNVIVTKNGKKIFPEEVESLLGRNELVRESLVYGIQDESGEMVVAAEIVPDFERLAQENGGQEPSEAIVRSRMADVVKGVNQLLVPYKYIRNFHIRREEFDKTTTKKIKRHTVRIGAAPGGKPGPA